MVGKAVRDDDDGARLRKCFERFLNDPFGNAVDGIGRLVEHQDIGVPDNRAGERQPLQLAGRKPDAPIANLRQVAVRQRGDEFVRVRLFGSVDDLLVAGGEPAVRNVVADGGIEDVAVLADDRNLLSPRRQIQCAEWLAVIRRNLAVGLLRRGEESA